MRKVDYQLFSLMVDAPLPVIAHISFHHFPEIMNWRIRKDSLAVNTKD
jgi:hypothetical protein